MAEPVGSSETGANAIRAVSAGANPPSGDHLVTDIFVDFAAGFCDRERYIDDEAVEKPQEAKFSEALGGTGRGAHIDEQERPLFDARLIITPCGEGEEHTWTQKIAHAEQEEFPQGPASARIRNSTLSTARN